MVYNVIITTSAMKKLESYIQYTMYVLRNKEAAKEIRNDAKATKKVLADLASINPVCEHPILKQYGYRKQFFLKHKFIMIYRIDGSNAIVEGMYHELQDYESLFIPDINFSN